MAKSREKVQQLGFWDTQVSSPDHDAVCLWAYKNADLIARKAFPKIFDRSWSNHEIGAGLAISDQDAMELARRFASITPRPNPRIAKRTLEYVLRSYTGYQEKLERIIGYADILIETELPFVAARYVDNPRPYTDAVIDGFEVLWSRGREAPDILVEAKSVLPTVGELMRQINLYRTAFGGKIVVVSPDESYAKILEEQDVSFVQYVR